MSVDIIQIAAVTVTSAAGHRRPNLVEPHAARPTIFLTAATMTTMASAPARPLLQPRRPLPPPFVPIAGALLEILGLKVAEERPLARILCRGFLWPPSTWFHHTCGTLQNLPNNHMRFTKLII